MTDHTRNAGSVSVDAFTERPIDGSGRPISDKRWRKQMRKSTILGLLAANEALDEMMAIEIAEKKIHDR